MVVVPTTVASVFQLDEAHPEQTQSVSRRVRADMRDQMERKGSGDDVVVLAGVGAIEVGVVVKRATTDADTDVAAKRMTSSVVSRESSGFEKGVNVAFNGDAVITLPSESVVLISIPTPDLADTGPSFPSPPFDELVIAEDVAEIPKSSEAPFSITKGEVDEEYEDENKLPTPKPSPTDETPKDGPKDEVTANSFVALSTVKRKGAGRAFAAVRKILRSMGT